VPTIVRVLTVLLVIGGVLAGCGGDDDDGGDAATSETTEASDAGDDDDGGNLDDELAALGTGECRDAAEAFLSAAEGALGFLDGPDSQMDDAVDQLRAFADVAPDEIKDDFETVVDAYGELAEAFADLDFDPSSGEAPSDEVMQQLEEIGSRFQESDLQEASDNISAWFDEHCGIDTAG
jgi:hypothetical protein